MKKKKYLLNKILPYFLTLTIATAGTSYIKKENEQIEEQSLGVSDDNSMSLDNGIFFQKVENEEVDLDDVVLNNTERNIISYYGAAEELEEALSNQLKNINLDPEEKQIIEALNIRELMEDFLLSSNVTDKLENHHNSALYSEETDDILWDELFNTIKKNNIYKIYIEPTNKLIDEESETTENICYSYDALSDHDIKIWIKQFKEFVQELRKEATNFDMKRLACILEDYCVCGYYPNYSEVGTIAKTSKDSSIYPLWNSDYPDMKKFKKTNYHEFQHIISYYCEDEKNSSGVPFGLSFRFYETSYTEQKLKKYQENTHYPFDYRFIEEALAEDFSTSLLETEPTTYKNNIFITNNLKLSLIFQKGFAINNFEQAEIFHNPIAFIQQFPILSNEKDWLITQLEMLECYNIINSKDLLKRFCFNKDQELMDENTKKVIICLENYADLQMTRNFLWNLANSKNTTKKNITLEDCNHLVNLYKARLAMQRYSAAKLNGISLQELNNVSYKERENEIYILFNNYLENEYCLDYVFIGDKSHNLKDGELSNCFNNKEKEYFNNLITEIDTYYEWIEERENYNESDFFEEVKKYYKEY